MFINLAIADKGIYFVPEDSSSIQFLDLQTNQIRRIASFEGRLADVLALSPDGRWILYAKFDQASAELRLVENFN